MNTDIEKLWEQQKVEQHQIASVSIIVLVGAAFVCYVANVNGHEFGGMWEIVLHYVNLWLGSSLIWAAVCIFLDLLSLDSGSIFTVPYELMFFLSHRVTYPHSPALWYRILYTIAASLMVIPTVVLMPVLWLGYMLFRRHGKEA